MGRIADRTTTGSVCLFGVLVSGHSRLAGIVNLIIVGSVHWTIRRRRAATGPASQMVKP